MKYSPAVLAALIPMLLVCGGTSPEPPVPTAPDPTPVVEPVAPEAVSLATPPASSLTEVVVIASDGDWNTLALFDGLYLVPFPGTFEWEVTTEANFTAYRASELYNGRIYTVWVHRYPPGSEAIEDPYLVDDSAAAYAITLGSGGVQRVDLTIGRGIAKGRGMRFTYDKDGKTYYNDLVVFRRHNDLIFHHITSRPDYAPIEHFRRMNDGFSSL